MGIDERVRHPQALELGADRHQVGLAGASSVGARRVGSDAVVEVAHRALRVVTADRQDVRVVRRVGQPRCADAPLVASVARGGHHDDPRPPCSLCGEREGIHERRLRRVGAVRQVEHPDVHAVVVLVIDDPVDRRDHLRHIDASIGGSDLETDDASIRSDAAILGRRGVRVGLLQRRVLAGDEAGDERAMTVGVEVRQVRSLRFQREIRAVDDLVGCRQTLDRCDPRVDDRYVDAGPGDPVIPELCGADVLGHRLHRVAVENRVVDGCRRRLCAAAQNWGNHADRQRRDNDAPPDLLSMRPTGASAPRRTARRPVVLRHLVPSRPR